MGNGKYMTFKGVPKTNVTGNKIGKPASIVPQKMHSQKLSPLGKKY